MIRFISSIALVSALVLLGGCGLSSAPGTGGAKSAGGKSKTITIKGSDTMVILCQRWAEVYMHHNSAIDVQVTGGGSGTGIAALINGGTDICAASRPMKDKEKQQVKAKHNQDSVETAVALDGLTVYLNKNNPVKQLSVEQLDKIYRAQITDWKDVGGTPGKIVCYGRENSSGTYAYFKEHVLKEKDFATEVQSLPGTAAVIHAVGKDPNGIGYGGKAYESKDTDVKECAVSTKEGEAATLPSLANVVSGTYPLSRKLFFYTAGQPGGEVKTFIDWVLGEEGQKVCDQVGYYPIPKK